MFKLETDRLYLRELNQNDFDNLKIILSDKENMSFYPSPYDDKGVQRWIDWNLNNYRDLGFGLFALILKETGEFIGDTGLTIQNIHGHYRIEVGYHINKRYWRQGYAKEACKAVIDWAFNNTPFETLYSYLVKGNIASENTAKSNGMTLLEEYLDSDGTPLLVYKLEKKDWLKRK